MESSSGMHSTSVRYIYRNICCTKCCIIAEVQVWIIYGKNSQRVAKWQSSALHKHLIQEFTNWLVKMTTISRSASLGESLRKNEELLCGIANVWRKSFTIVLLLFQDFFVFVLSLNDEHNVVIAKKKLIVSCNLIVGKSSSATCFFFWPSLRSDVCCSLSRVRSTFVCPDRAFVFSFQFLVKGHGKADPRDSHN